MIPVDVPAIVECVDYASLPINSQYTITFDCVDSDLILTSDSVIVNGKYFVKTPVGHYKPVARLIFKRKGLSGAIKYKDQNLMNVRRSNLKPKRAEWKPK